MTTLTLIGEPFPDWEAEIQRSAALDLTVALASTAPRACAARLLIAKGREAPRVASPKVRVESLPLSAGMLPMLWQSGTTARPLDGELVHSLTPMIPVRARNAEDGTQTSVTVPHTLAWEAPALLGSSQARLFRSFVRRAVKHADVIVTPTYAVAAVLQKHYGESLPVQVLPLAPPTELLRPDDAEDRLERFELPEHYLVTTATPTEHGRLEWILDAMEADTAIAHLVVIEGFDPVGGEQSRGGEGRKGKTAAGKQSVDAASPSAAAAVPTGDLLTEASARGSGEAAAEATQSTTRVDAAEAPETARPEPAAAAASPGDSALRAKIPEALRDRVTVVRPGELRDIGALLSGARLLVHPQSVSGSGYLLLAGLAAGVPSLHAGNPVCAEIALDAGVAAEDQAAFGAELSRIATSPDELERLSVLATDRSRTFSWVGTAWSLWELHANL